MVYLYYLTIIDINNVKKSFGRMPSPLALFQEPTPWEVDQSVYFSKKREWY